MAVRLVGPVCRVQLEAVLFIASTRSFKPSPARDLHPAPAGAVTGPGCRGITDFGDDQVLLRLGDPPSPMPEPVTDLLLEYLGQRTNMRTATNRDSRWLGPLRCGIGRHARPADTLVRSRRRVR